MLRISQILPPGGVGIEYEYEFEKPAGATFGADELGIQLISMIGPNPLKEI